MGSLKLTEFACTMGNVFVNPDTEFTEWHCDIWFKEICQEKSNWIRKNYPHVEILRQTLTDPARYHLLVTWYANFTNTAEKTHYVMVHGTKDTQG